MEVIKPKKKKQCLMKVGLPQLCVIRPEEFKRFQDMDNSRICSMSAVRKTLYSHFTG